jgi:Protein of unknown function (DUF3579)
MLNNTQRLNSSLNSNKSRCFYIKGKTLNGEIFRPSDWVERLCGIMSQFSPNYNHNSRQLTYSEYVKPADLDGVKSVLVNSKISEIEPKALDFLYSFAKDNNLPIIYIE